MKISSSFVRQKLEGYGFTATEQLCSQIVGYVDLLLGWNRKISLTTVVNPEDIVRFHFGESIFALSQGVIAQGRLADVGTGAGFPGLPLRLACPSIELTLLESNMKKCVFLREAVRTLRLESGVTICNDRSENFARGPSDLGFDFVTARAVGHFDETLEFSKATLARGGRLVLWLGEREAGDLSSKHSSEWNWSDPVRIPGSDRRFLMWANLK
jgi:16S rRNA (guanine527-N7)-methyltransferase